ncbi:MAG: DUF748 domain-containing protein [Desulfobulbaceae bacterium]|nr:DUF748 domain-containing protein [Desulfobulbaceae bacterium]
MTKRNNNTTDLENSAELREETHSSSTASLPCDDDITLVIGTEERKEAMETIDVIPLSGSAPPPRQRGKVTSPRTRNPRRHKNDTPPTTLGRKLLTWLFVVPVFGVCLYALVGFMVVPSLIKSTLAEKLSQRTGNRVMVGNVLFSPFTLNLRISDFQIATDGQQEQSGDLLLCDDMELDFDLMASPHVGLLINRLVIGGLELNLTRFQDTDFNVSRFHSKLFPDDGTAPFIPPERLSVNEIVISNSRIVYTDLPTGKKHRIEEVDFVLPPSDSSKTASPLTPKFKGMVNGSPVVVDGIMGFNERGEKEAKLKVDFKGVEPQAYQSLILPAESGAHFSGGSADCSLQLVFTEAAAGKKKISLGGSLALRDIALNDQEDRLLSLLPVMNLEFITDPQRQVYRIVQMSLNNPDIHFYSQNESLTPRLIFNSPVFMILSGSEIAAKGKAIDRLEVKNGSLTIHHNLGKQRDSVTWKNIGFNLTGYADQGYRESGESLADQGSFSLKSQSLHAGEEMTLSVSGDFDHTFSGKGQFAAANIDMSLHQYFLFTPKNLVFRKGWLDFSGNFQFSPLLEKDGDDLEKESGGLILESGALTLRDYSLVSDKKEVLNGSSAHCSEIIANVSSKSVSCALLELKKQEFLPGWWQESLFSLSHQAKKDWDFQPAEVKISDSIAHASFPSDLVNGGDILLSNINLNAKQQGESPGNGLVSVEADISNKGHFSGKGGYDFSSGQANITSTFTNLDVNIFKPLYSSWLVVPVTGGTINATGDIYLPRCRFVGSLEIRELRAGNPETVLSFQNAFTDKIAVTFQPFHLGAEQVTVEQPTVFYRELPGMPGNGFIIPPSDAAPGSVYISPIDLNTIELKNGSVEYSAPVVASDFPAKFEGIHGTLTELRSRGDIRVDLKGKLSQGGIFALTGTTGLSGMKHYELQVRDLPLSVLADTFKKRMGVAVTGATIDWEQRVKEDSNLTHTDLVVKNLKPGPDSDYQAPFSLLIDKDESVRLSLEGQRGESPPFLDDFFKLLARYKIKAAIAPQLLLKEFLPDLSLDGAVKFEPGKTTSDQLDILKPYRTLLNQRPHLCLQLIGGTDLQKETALLAASLFEEAEKKRLVENERRARKREELLEAEKKRLASIKADSGQVIEEKISSEELIGENLQPLEPVNVDVKPQLLDEVAASRARFVSEYLVNTLAIAKERVLIAPESKKDTTSVSIQIKPR